MLCGNAVGEILPPYVVYKSIGMWGTWRNKGPKGARYNCSSSSWFDSGVFFDQFQSFSFQFHVVKQGIKF